VPVLKIKDLAALQSGLPLGSRDFVDDGNAWVLQGNSITRLPVVVNRAAEGEFIKSARDSVVSYKGQKDKLRQVKVMKSLDEKAIQKNDVLFRARGGLFESLKAYLPFDQQDTNISDGKPYVINNTLINLRPNSNVIPRYLAWAINNFRSELFLQSSRSGAAALMTVSIKQLAEVSLPVPTYKVQETILATFDDIEKSRAIAEAKNDAANQLLCGLAEKHS